MRVRVGFFRRPLDEIFAAPSHVSVLRALLDSAQGMSGREVGRRARISHAAATRALHRLTHCGVVQRLGSGTTQLFRLDQANVLVTDLLRPLFLRERETYRHLLELLRRTAKRSDATVVLYGSAAREQETPDSDLDLLLIAPSAGEREATHELGAMIAEEVGRQLGYRVAPMVLTRAQLRQRRDEPLIAAIRREGIVVSGDGLEEMLSGARSTTSPSQPGQVA
jgi:predicted nucleotidyltransferase